MSEHSPTLHDQNALRLLIDQITDYAIFVLRPSGEVASWNPGAERIKGYKGDEIIGRHIRIFYVPEEASWKPDYELNVAASVGRFEDEGWRVRKDGSRFWANVVITRIRDPRGELVGFGKVTRDLTERKLAEDQRRELSIRLLKMQDEERSRLGRELHDSVGQYLAAVKMTLDQLATDGRVEKMQIRADLESCLGTVEHAIREVRTLSYLLYPPMLDENGLVSAIRWHLDGFSKRSGIRVSAELADGIGRLPKEIELALFRIFQESLTNIHRHAQSQTAHVQLGLRDDTIFLNVQDNGKGMPPEFAGLDVDRRGILGVGIRGMQERVTNLGGRLEIASTREGTTVMATIPLKNAALTGQKNQITK